ncbi:hypothetical protein CcCBS67573_g08725 [Chytriomyces confervae]|uniref:IMD domain-containing protein n=1 Tax=Chytriomyces confervae TaxID=246404 RepID=A0A507EJ85_9FUNG|nr:hypothetical protein CcCBS67573_g08725 [Chytriomyces confervae]
MMSSKRKNTPINKDDISLPLPTQELLMIPTVALSDLHMTPPRMSPTNSISNTNPSLGRMKSGSQSGARNSLAFKAYVAYVNALGVYKSQISSMAAASDAFVRACEDLEVAMQSTPGVDQVKVKDLNSLIDSTHVIANSHQIWAENLGQDVVDPLKRHLGDIMLTVKARQDKNKARIDDLVGKLHKEEEHSYKLSKKKQRDLVMLQDSLGLRVTLADEIKRLTVESASIGDVLAANSMDLLLNSCSATVYTQLETYESMMEGLKKARRLFLKPSSKESILRTVTPQMMPRQASLRSTPAPRSPSSNAGGFFPPEFDAPQPPGTELGLSYREIAPDDSISNIAPQYSAESIAAMEMNGGAPPQPPGMQRNASRNIPGPGPERKFRLFGGR